MSQIEKDLKDLCNLAKKLGATNAKSFNAKGVMVDERVRLKCLIPPCDDLGLNLMCPPYIMSVQEFREIFSRYKWAILIQIDAPILQEMKNQILQATDVASLYTSKTFTNTYKKAFDPIRSKLHNIVNKVEAHASMLGYRFATGFKAGPCKLCPECIVKNSEKICRHPYQSRPSMEAVGIDVFKTAQNAGLPFDIPIKNKVVWNGLVLIS
jgi:predicted metal-binding protein